MSLSETSPFRKFRSLSRDWRHFAIVLMALPAGGCFQPLYGEAAHPGLVADMQAIVVEPIKGANQDTSQQAPDLDRIAHYLGNDLIANLNGTGASPEPKYRLTVTAAFTTATPTVTSQIQVANAATVTITARYVLKRAGDGQEVVSGVANNAAVYDRTEDRFANIRAQRDAEIRLAKSLADEIELRLAARLGERS
jgi:LPS-assembly lipoprotein